MHKNKKFRTPSPFFGVLILLALLSACGKKPPPLAPESVNKDTRLMQALSQGLQIESPTSGVLWIVMPPPLSQREGEKIRVTTLKETAQTQLPDWEIEVVYPSEEDLQRYESQLYGGDFPVSMLRNLIQSNSTPTALFCFKGVPTGPAEELKALARECLLGGVARYGEVEADPLLKAKLLRVAAMSDEKNISWKTAKSPKWVPLEEI